MNMFITHMSLLIEVVIGEFEFMECARLLHPVGAGRRGVGMDVEPAGHVGFCLTRHYPLRVMISVGSRKSQGKGVGFKS